MFKVLLLRTMRFLSHEPCKHPIKGTAYRSCGFSRLNLPDADSTRNFRQAGKTEAGSMLYCLAPRRTAPARGRWRRQNSRATKCLTRKRNDQKTKARLCCRFVTIPSNRCRSAKFRCQTGQRHFNLLLGTVPGTSRPGTIRGRTCSGFLLGELFLCHCFCLARIWQLVVSRTPGTPAPTISMPTSTVRQGSGTSTVSTPTAITAPQLLKVYSGTRARSRARSRARVRSRVRARSRMYRTRGTLQSFNRRRT